MPASRFGTPRSYPCAPTFSPNSFRLIHFRKNASANPLESHSFKTKDLKPFRFTHFQKKGRGCPPLSDIQPQISNLSSLRAGGLARLNGGKRTAKNAPDGGLGHAREVFGEETFIGEFCDGYAP